VTLWSDGGGKSRVARNAIHGAANVARFLYGALRKAPPSLAVRPARVNGSPGLVGYFGDGRPHSVAIFEVAGGRIVAIRIVVNPEKLEGVSPLPPEAGR
jgi:RNA polymerase sigma-70 factor (ECF subfamily)